MPPKRFCPYCAAPLATKFIEGRQRRWCGQSEQVLYENPIPANCLIVSPSCQHILLVKRGVAPKIGMWCLPGGFMELDETPESGALRELAEETGLIGRKLQLLGVRSTPSRQYNTVLMMGFWVHAYVGRPAAGDDALAIRSFHIDRLPEIAFETHEHFIDVWQRLKADCKSDRP